MFIFLQLIIEKSYSIRLNTVRLSGPGFSGSLETEDGM